VTVLLKYINLFCYFYAKIIFGLQCNTHRFISAQHRHKERDSDDQGTAVTFYIVIYIALAFKALIRDVEFELD